MNLNLTQDFKIVDATAGPVTTNGGVTTDTVSLKNAVRAWLVLQLTQAVGHATAIALKQATDVASATNKAGPTSQVWANEDTATSDTLVRKTAGASYTVTNDIKKKLVVIEVDPAAFDFANGYDCAYATVGDSSQATNFVSGTWIIQERYAQATPPAAITD